MKRINLGDRVLIHLGRHMNCMTADDHIAPEDLTQTGIAMEMGLSRNHVSVILLKLEDEGFVFNRLCRIRHSRTGLKRKAYGLTAAGNVEYNRILEELKRNGIDEKEFVGAGNINQYSGEQIDGLSERDINVIGMICVLGIGVGKNTLDYIPRMVPFDNGMSSIRNETVQRIIDRSSDDAVKHWNSLAADYCLDNDIGIQRRIKHLVLSERFVEAKRLVMRDRFYIMDNPRKIILPALMDLSERYPLSDIPYISAITAMRAGCIREATLASKIVSSTDKELGMALESEIVLKQGEFDHANMMALDSYRGDVETSMTLGKTMMASGNYDQALFFLRTARRDMKKRRCIFGMDEELRIESELLRKMGRADESARLGDIATTISDMICGKQGSIRERCSSSDYPNRRCTDHGCL